MKHLQQALRTSHGRRPPGTSTGFRGGGGGGAPGTALGTPSALMRGTTAAMGGGGRPITGMADGVSRPMTGIRGAGYPGTSAGGRTTSGVRRTSAGGGPGRGMVFDPLGQGRSGSPGSSILDQGRRGESPEEKVKLLEKKVNALIEESCFAGGRGESKLALDRAKEASTKERSIIRLREQAGLSDSHNLDLTFSVLFNLANQYAANDMFTEALNTYQVRINPNIHANEHI